MEKKVQKQYKHHYSEILNDPIFNKGTGFTLEERKKLRIRGLLPTNVETLEQQTARCLQQLRKYSVDLNKWIYLNALASRNQTLFYRLIVENLVETMPIVYTPTVGQACMEFSHENRSIQGMYISIQHHKGEIRTILDNWETDPDIIVVTDGSRILGLGDLGVNGMGIPVGKLSLYIAAAGFDPANTLPIVLDVGTNNEQFLKDPLYLGNKIKRIRGKDFDDFADEFLMAVKDKWPNCLLQFEDFSNDVCFDLLEKYRHKMLCFNDDIQGTGAVIVSGFMNAVKLSGVEMKKHKIIFLGAGSAAVGVATEISKQKKFVLIFQKAKMMMSFGSTYEEAHDAFYLIDSQGLVTTNRGDKLASHKIPFARKDFTTQYSELLNVIKVVKPTCLIGLSGQGGSFTEEIVKEFAKHSEKPIIFPLSNPTSKSETSAENAYKWTEGRCIFASGSPFNKVEYNGKTFTPGQGNNMYIFPGLGLGAVVSKSKHVSDDMVLVAAKTLAGCVTDEEFKAGKIYPDLNNIRQISKTIAVAVAHQAVKEKLSDYKEDTDFDSLVTNYMYYPEYSKL